MISIFKLIDVINPNRSNFMLCFQSFFGLGMSNRGVARSKTVGWTEGASRTHGERGARAYNGVLGAEPLVRGSGGTKPPEVKAFCRWTTRTRGKICHFSLVFL